MTIKVIKPSSSFGKKPARPHKKAKPKPKIPGMPSLPKPPRPKSRRDIIREAYRQAGALNALPPLRHTQTDLERILTARGMTGKIARLLSIRDQQELETDLGSIGIEQKHGSGTLPERLTVKYLLDKGLPYEGQGYQAQPNKGFCFQYPLEGGRAAFGGGAVADVFLAAGASNTPMGVVIRVNGAYWHNTPQAEAHDEAQRLRLVGDGYKVTDIMDTTILQPGPFDMRMTRILSGDYSD